jgi:FtsP/CotA-like multicopper oxidase with cupredoxin domain
MSRPTDVIAFSIAVVCTYACTPRSSTGQSFVNPVMLTSRDGKLHVGLVAAAATYAIGGRRFEGMLYNGQYMPPLWRLRAGDILTVTLHNQLSEETNLHFHGLNVSPLNNGDNVFLHIAPKQIFTYEIKIPQRHIGLFWYHPHAHGDVDRLIIGGLSGGILVEGSERLYPFLKGLTERVVLLKHHPIGGPNDPGTPRSIPQPATGRKSRSTESGGKRLLQSGSCGAPPANRRPGGSQADGTANSRQSTRCTILCPRLLRYVLCLRRTCARPGWTGFPHETLRSRKRRSPCGRMKGITYAG